MLQTAQTRKARVLFVDDEQRILTSMKMLFRREYEVFTCNSGAEALELLKEQKVEVVVSDQRMPKMTGIELLREVRDLQPQAIRLLLTGYADLNAIIGSINEGEIFRFVSKPWSNEDLKATLAKAVAAAEFEATIEEAEASKPAAASEAAEEEAKPGILLLDQDADSRSLMKDMLAGDFNVFEADTIAECLDLLEKEDLGVIISDIYIQGTPVVELLSLLKQHQPHLVSIIVTNRADAHAAIDLINHGQVYRFLMRPVREAMCKINVRSAIRRYSTLATNPQRTKRYEVETIEKPEALASTFVSRIRSMRSLFGGANS
ncbi:MAG: response regulator [Salinisphaeraceae bacterium]|nr:response regulator [Salinisphaeraceae bacterium]